MRVGELAAAPTARFDALIVGGGLAGLRAALDCADAGLRVGLIARGGAASGASFYPFTDGLGCQLPENDADADAFLQELLDVGCGLASEPLYRLQVAAIPREVERLAQLGIQPYRLRGRAACFAARERIICAWDGWPEVRRRLGGQLAARPALTLLEADAADLICREGAVCGVWALRAEGRLQPLYAPAVLLASGGPCGLFGHSLSAPECTGAAASMALAAGAALTNMEFVQFIPGLMRPVYRWLFCEIALRHCTALTDTFGAPLLRDVLPPGLTQEACLAARAMHAPFTVRDDSRWFDIAMLRAIRRTGRDEGCLVRFADTVETDDNEFMASARGLYARAGLRLSEGPLALAPFAHSANGGVCIDSRGRTGVPGLWCAGEAAGGPHGADRQGGVATAAALVFGARAAADMVQSARGAFIPAPAPRDAEALAERLLRPALPGAPEPAADAPPAAALLQSLGRLLWLTANVQRTHEELARARAQIAAWAAAYRPLADMAAGTPAPKALCAYHALRTADAMLAAMDARAESRGGHFRADAPAQDDARFARRLLVREGPAGFACLPQEEKPAPAGA